MVHLRGDVRVQTVRDERVSAIECAGALRAAVVKRNRNYGERMEIFTLHITDVAQVQTF